MHINRRQLLTAATAMVGASAWSQTSAFPNRPVRIVPFGTAGGPIDGLARAFDRQILNQRHLIAIGKQIANRITHFDRVIQCARGFCVGGLCDQ